MALGTIIYLASERREERERSEAIYLATLAYGHDCIDLALRARN